MIIDNRSDLSDHRVLSLVMDVINEGRVCNDNKQYVYLSVYHLTCGDYQVSTDLNKESDRFVIVKEKK